MVAVLACLRAVVAWASKSIPPGEAAFESLPTIPESWAVSRGRCVAGCDTPLW